MSNQKKNKYSVKIIIIIIIKKTETNIEILDIMAIINGFKYRLHFAARGGEGKTKKQGNLCCDIDDMINIGLILRRVCSRKLLINNVSDLYTLVLAHDFQTNSTFNCILFALTSKNNRMAIYL